MSKLFAKIKKFYDNGFWTKDMVGNVVGKPNGITAEEYELITGETWNR